MRNKIKDLKGLIKEIVSNTLHEGSGREDLESNIENILFIGYIDDKIGVHMKDGKIYTIEIKVRKI